MTPIAASNLDAYPPFARNTFLAHNKAPCQERVSGREGSVPRININI
jgi:hypothetical protein